jgi:2-succinyl-6-hydroxy-2,4-cyclohexadiene-1-carboxylate synthase
MIRSAATAAPSTAAPHGISRRVRLRDALELHVHERGTGPALLLVHGFTGSGAAFGEAVLAPLAAHHRVLAVDLIGHGASDRPHAPERYAMAQIARDLCDVLDACALPRAAVLGYSMGARAALGLTILAPGRVAALLCEGGSPGLREAHERSARVAADEALARELESHGIAPFVERWMNLPLFATQKRLPGSILAGERERRLANDPRALAACLRGLGTGSQPSFWEALADVRVPVLLLAGALDARYGELAQAMQTRIPDARTALVADAGHTAHLERPGAYLAAVQPFIDRTWSGRAT